MKYPLLPFYFKKIGIVLFALALIADLAMGKIALLPLYSNNLFIKFIVASAFTLSLLIGIYYLSRSMTFLVLLLAGLYAWMFFDFLNAKCPEASRGIQKVMEFSELIGLLLFAMARDKVFDEFMLNLRLEAIQLSFFIMCLFAISFLLPTPSGWISSFILMRNQIISFWILFKIKKRKAINSAFNKSN